MKTTLHFGIEINFGVANKFHDEIYESNWIKIENSNRFIQKISDSYEDNEQEIKTFASDAKKIKSFDIEDTTRCRTDFYLVVYAMQGNELISVKRIRDIFY